MLNLNELESQWLRYKIKSYIPHFIIVLSLIVIITIVSIVEFSQNVKPTKVEEQNLLKESNKTTKKSESTNTINKTETKVSKQIVEKIEKLPTTPKSIDKEVASTSNETIKKEKLLIKPSLDFIRSMKDNSPTYYDEEIKSMLPVSKEELPKKQKIVSPKIEEIILDTRVEEPQKKVQVADVKEIKIKRQNTQDDIQHVVKRFKQSNNPALSLFIAKKYYELENYNQAYNYALLTNEINNDIEESWIIFAKSLYKLDKKDKAIEMLNEYISSSHSHRAKILLDNMKHGRLK